MTLDAKDTPSRMHEAAVEKLRRLRQSPKYSSFLRQEVIDAFAKVEQSALAGKSLPPNKRRDSSNND